MTVFLLVLTMMKGSWMAEFGAGCTCTYLSFDMEQSMTVFLLVLTMYSLIV